MSKQKRTNPPSFLDHPNEDDWWPCTPGFWSARRLTRLVRLVPPTLLPPNADDDTTVQS